MRHPAVFVLAAAALSLGAVGSASSGDLGRPPVYGSPPPPPVYYNWTGCYAGLNAGGVWSINDMTAGFTGGGQAGCNWQMNAFVLGGEADVQYTGLDGSHDALGGTTTIHEDFRSRWLATFRGRLGWLINPSMLIYGTGGLAVANVDTTASWDSGTASEFNDTRRVDHWNRLGMEVHATVVRQGRIPVCRSRPRHHPGFRSRSSSLGEYRPRRC